MISKAVQEFLDEINRVEYLDLDKKKFNEDTPVVNGISRTQGIDFYSRKIERMYETFLNEVNSHEFTDMIKIKQSLENSIVKLNNFYKIEEYRSQRLYYEFNGEEFDFQKKQKYRQKVPFLQLFEDVYFKQFDILSNAEKRVREILIQKDPNREVRFDPTYLFNIFPNKDFNRVIQRIVNTLHSLKLIDPNFGGTADNFRLLFDRYNPKFKSPEKIRWNGEYDQLAFFISTIRERNLIIDESKAATNHYSKACMWFTDKEGKSFSQCHDPKKRRYTGRKAKYDLFYRRIVSDIDASEE